MKPLEAASMITKEGGVIILVGHCTVPFSDFYLKGCERFRLKYQGQLKKSIIAHFSKNRRILQDGAPELNMSMAQALLAQDRFKVILVSEEVPKEHTELLGFLPATDLHQAFDISAAITPNPEVHIVPSGGVILPVLQKN